MSLFLDRNLTFYLNDVPFILLTGMSRICFDVMIIDDNENERDEVFYFYLYHHNGNMTETIDKTSILIHDNEEGKPYTYILSSR